MDPHSCRRPYGLSRQRAALLLTAAMAVGAISCGDPYLAVNPYDPDTAVALTITGPDTLYSFAQQASYTVASTPAFPDSAYHWNVDTSLVVVLASGGDSTVDGTRYLNTLGNGTFQSSHPPLEPATATVNIQVLIGGVDTVTQQYEKSCMCVIMNIHSQQYRHIANKTVVLTQRVVRIQLRCPDVHACSSVAVGGSLSIWVDGFDALGHPIVALTDPSANPAANPPASLPVATFASRDTTIARISPVGIRATTVTALKTGSTWIVATRNSLSDSLQVVVH